MATLKDITDALQHAGIPLKPCSIREVQELEQHHSLKLPDTYRSFLYYCGHGAGRFMTGTDVFYPFLFDLTTWGKEFMAEHNLPPLPGNAFVFWMHQGYMLAWFICDGNSNPQVHFMTESENGTDYIHYDSLADFLYPELMAAGIIKP